MNKIIYLLAMLFCFYSSVNASVFYVTNRFDSKVLKVDTQTNDVSVFINGGLTDHAISVKLSDDNSSLYVTSGGNGKIIKYDTSTGAGIEFASGFRPPHDMAFDSLGYMYLSLPGTNTIAKINPDGSNITSFAQNGLLSSPAGLAFGPQGHLFVANSGNDTIVKFSADGLQSSVILSTGLTDPGVLIIDKDDNLFVAERNGGQVTKCTLAGSVLTTISTGLSQPYGMGFDSDGIFYVADRSRNYIAKYDTDFNLIGTITSSLFNGPGFLDFENDFIPDPVVIPEPMSFGLLLIAVTCLIDRKQS